MKVVITTDALNDLEQIGDYIARDNPTRAQLRRRVGGQSSRPR